MDFIKEALKVLSENKKVDDGVYDTKNYSVSRKSKETKTKSWKVLSSYVQVSRFGKGTKWKFISTEDDYNRHLKKYPGCVFVGYGEGDNRIIALKDNSTDKILKNSILDVSNKHVKNPLLDEYLEKKKTISPTLTAVAPVTKPVETVELEAVPKKTSDSTEIVDNSVNARLLRKIDEISVKLADALEKEGISDDIDPELIKQDMIRDCGLMGEIISPNVLDVENNPFDRATKDMMSAVGRVDPTQACNMLLNVPSDDFVNVIIRGIRASRGVLPGGRAGALGNRRDTRLIGKGNGGTRESLSKTKINKFSIIAERYANKLVSTYLREDILGKYNKNYPGLLKDTPEERAQSRGRVSGGAKPGDENGTRVPREMPLEYLKHIAFLACLDPIFDTSNDDINKERTEKEIKEILTKEPGPYFEWILRFFKSTLKTHSNNFEETMNMFKGIGHEIKDQLKIYNDLKKENRLPADKRDINQACKTLDALMDLINSLAAVDDNGSVSSAFKTDVSDVRKALKEFAQLSDNEIPQNIQKSSDAFKFITENDKYDVVVPLNVYGSILLDTWGAGAAWCVGGFGWKGTRGLSQAKQYFNTYNVGGAQYVCFMPKKPSESRHKRFLITLGPGGSKPQHSSGYQFNNAFNKTMVLKDGVLTPIDESSYGSASQDMQMDAFGVFLRQSGLLNAFKNTEFRGVAAIADIENEQRLENNEPYVYFGGTIKDKFKSHIKKIEFTSPTTNKVIVIDVSDFDTNLLYKCTSIEDMDNMVKLHNNEPYVYKGEVIKDIFKPLITEIVVSDEYSGEVPLMRKDTNTGKVVTSNMVGLKRQSFLGCNNLKRVVLSPVIKCVGVSAFVGCPDDVKIIIPKDSKILCPRSESAWIEAHKESM